MHLATLKSSSNKNAFLTKRSWTTNDSNGEGKLVKAIVLCHQFLNSQN